MRSHQLVMWVSVLSLYSWANASNGPRIPAFPGAEGFGMFVTGGRGGQIYEVTNLLDSGSGSLRDAVSAPNRTIVFRTSGTIELKSTLMLDQPNITIAGQTAPGDGICLKNYALRVNAENIIVRFLRVRPGDLGSDDQVDGISMGPRGGSDLIFDHCSVSWALDENFSIYGLPNVTVQWCIISEALFHSKHPKGRHSMGGLLSGRDTSLHHNLFVSNNDRNPKFDVADRWPGKNTDFRNNVIYNWGSRATWGGNGGCSLINVVANYYKPGPNSINRLDFLTLEKGVAGAWFVDGNYVEGSDEISLNNWQGIKNADKTNEWNALKEGDAFPAAPVVTQNAKEAFNAVLIYAGAYLPKRDIVDERIVDEVRIGKGKIINSQDDVGGWPELKSIPAPLDSDHDGMPDEWEMAHHLDPLDNRDGRQTRQNGYTEVENYLNSLVPVTLLRTAEDVRPGLVYWPSPEDGSKNQETEPTLRWKSGFSVERERVYLGTSPDLTEADFRQERRCAYRVVDKRVLTMSEYPASQLQNGVRYYWRVDSINEAGTRRGPVWSFTPGAPNLGPPEGKKRVEAEDMTLVGARLQSLPEVSGGKVTLVPYGVATLRCMFRGANGLYRISVNYLDQKSGQGRMAIAVDGRFVDSWTANKDSEVFESHTTSHVRIADGNVLTLYCERHRDELARVDYVEFIPEDEGVGVR